MLRTSTGLEKKIQNRSGSSIKSDLTKNWRFREYIGVGSAVTLITWNLISQYGLLLEGGMILHILWTLNFIKAYPQDAENAAAGGSNKIVSV